jgi:pyridoxal phosphate enzyme (YggS family)
VADLIEQLDPERVRVNVEQVREQIAQAARASGREPADVELLAAIKYLPADQLPVLAGAGITLVGENRAQELATKVAAHGELFSWDFIGQLQSRRVRQIVPHVRVLHSLASESALRELERHAPSARPGMEVLLEVDLSGEQGKAGISPGDVPAYVERCPLPVTGLMTMPPLAASPEDSRRWFSMLRELAQAHGLRRLSMGTTQDFAVAVEEGATIVRIGTRLYV